MLGVMMSPEYKLKNRYEKYQKKKKKIFNLLLS